MNFRIARFPLAAAILPAVALALLAAPTRVDACGGFFGPVGRTITQPGQTVFITFDDVRHEESYTVQSQFSGNAVDFGMLLPVPSRPRLDEMPRDFFAELNVFTTLLPQDNNKYLSPGFGGGRGGAAGAAGGRRGGGGAPGGPPPVQVLESGIVGTLDYKIIAADKADDLTSWLKDNNYAYSGDEATLNHYIQKKWLFVVAKIDTKQMKAKPDGTFEGQVTPTRFTFTSDQIVYPMHLTQLNVTTSTDALFYIQTNHKVDLGGEFSYQYTYVPMWTSALALERGSLVTDQEFAWNKVVGGLASDYARMAGSLRLAGHTPASLMWAKKITAKDIDTLSGTQPFDRRVPQPTLDQMDKLKLLKGSVAQGQFITKIRKSFTHDELNDDLVFVNAEINGQTDDTEYFETTPASVQAITDYSIPTAPARGTGARAPATRGTAARGPAMAVNAPQSRLAVIRTNLQTGVNNFQSNLLPGQKAVSDLIQADYAQVDRDLTDALTYSANHPEMDALGSIQDTTIGDLITKLQPYVGAVRGANSATPTYLRTALNQLNNVAVQLRSTLGGDLGGSRAKIISDLNKTADDLISLASGASP